MDTNTAALMVATVSLLVAGLSLGWQVAQWLLSAARPKATLLYGLVAGTGAYSAPVPKSGRRLDVDHLHRQGIGGLPIKVEPGANASWYVQLTAANLLASSSRDVLREPVTGVYMTAQLGTGKTVRTRYTLRT